MSQALTKGTAGAANGQADYCDNPSNKCNFGEGDCDTNAQCATGLVCGHAQGRRFPPLAADVDVCVPEHCQDAKQNNGETGVDCGGECGICLAVCGPQNGGDELGVENTCANADCLCAAGWGDCDSDGECAPGLVCAGNYGARYDIWDQWEVCVPAHCYNDLLDADPNDTIPDETEIDSGGECGHRPNSCNSDPGDTYYCQRCACGAGDGGCYAERDCAPGLTCVGYLGAEFDYGPSIRVCAEEHCGNNTQDSMLGETGIDCGGECGHCLPTCPEGNPLGSLPLGDTNYCVGCACNTGGGDCDRNRDCAPGLACTGSAAAFG